MMSRYTLMAALLIGPAGPATAGEPSPSSKELRAAVAKALPLIQKGGSGHMENRTCFACHNQAVPVLAMTTARSRGFAVSEEEIPQHLQFIADFLDQNRDNYLKGRGQGGQVDTAGYALWTLEMGGRKPDPITDAVAEYLLQRGESSKQTSAVGAAAGPAGLYHKDRDHWRSTSNRPPSEVSPFTTTYLAVRGLQTFGTPKQKARIAERLQVVRGWLAKSPARDTEDRVFRLWALKRVGAEDKQVQAAAQELIGSQRPDGGWAQLDTMKPDAYATGTALVALHQAAGLPTNDAVYRRGMLFLLTAQLGDGSWHVRSRSKPFQTYFESGFPHGKDQFISLAASSWATTALALGLPAVERSAGSGRAGRN
jgi:hypothetical protein